ncbi:MAG TPA: ABC transporter substrate-binding protein [Propionibacteriaceae bacterium]|nr:ABC transporter substrate-binding protein [Propionibacteriaceae bacterium]
MSRPESEAEYLARMVPPSVAGLSGLSRRSLFKTALGAAAVFGLPSVLAGCGGDSGGGGEGGAGGDSGGGGSVGGTITWGTNESGTTFAKQYEAQAADFAKKNAGTEVKINAADHDTFQTNINNYLQGNPDDVFTWFAGYRMKFFAARGLIGDVSDIWPLEGIAESFKTASTGDDGKQYFAPVSYYPWAIFYRKSVWEQKGYEVPKTLDELEALAKQMQDDKLIPFAFADKEGWPAMGTFDALNMRINGYQYHVDLMAGNKAWDSPETKKVFDTWRMLLPYHQPDALGRTWQEAAQSLQQKKSGMFLLGTFMNEQFPEAEREDLDFFTFPEVDPAIGADALDAPIDGSCMSANPKNEEGAKAFLKYLASPDSLAAAVASTKLPFISANANADESAYTSLQKKSAELVSQQKNIAQFLDRDTRPDFASTVVIPAFQTFLKNPDDIDGLTKSLEEQKKSIFAG